MAEEVAALNIRLQATTNKLETALRRAQRLVDRSSDRMERRARSLDKRMSDVGSRFGINISPRAAAATAALAALGKVINDTVRNGDKFRKLESRFEALTGSAERGAKAFQSVLDISADTGAGIDQVAGAITRFTIASEAIGATDEQVRQLTSNILKLGELGGGSTSELAAGAQQLGQALASGRLQGDELRSILENMPLVARAIADGLGVSVGQLRQMGSEGELTARKVFDAILAKTEEIESDFKRLPPTLSRVSGQLAASWAKFTASIDQSTGASQRLVSAIGALPSVIDKVSASLQRGNLTLSPLGLVATALQDPRAIEARDRVEASEIAPGVPRATLTPNGSGFFGPGLKLPEGGAGGPRRGSRGRAGGSAGPKSLPKGFLPPETPFELGVPDPVSGGGGGVSLKPSTDAVIAHIAALRDLIQVKTEEHGAIGLIPEELERYTARLEAARFEQELLAIAGRDGNVVTDDHRKKVKELADEYLVLSENIIAERAALEASTAAARDEAQALEDGRRQIQSISDDIFSAIEAADSFTDALKRIGVQLAQLAVTDLLKGSGTGGKGGSAILDAVSSIGGALFNAKGNAFGPSGVTKFAKGGVVDSPTPFQFGGGRLGLMGEAGPEAVMPLARGPDGKLGVRGGGGGGTTIIQNTFNGVNNATKQEILAMVRQIDAKNRADTPSIASQGFRARPGLR